MADFTPFGNLILQIEGGYQNNPADTGNIYSATGANLGTNWGITPDTLSAYRGGALITKRDILTLDRGEAWDIYETLFWNPANLSGLRSQAVANIIADHEVNAGGKNGIYLLQFVLNSHFGENLQVDGNLGPATKAAANRQEENSLFNAIREERIKIYTDLGQVNPTFANGWLNRINDNFPALAENDSAKQARRDRRQNLTSGPGTYPAATEPKKTKINIWVIIGILAAIAGGFYLTKKYLK